MCSDILIKFWETFWPTGRGGGGVGKKFPDIILSFSFCLKYSYSTLFG